MDRREFVSGALAMALGASMSDPSPAAVPSNDPGSAPAGFNPEHYDPGLLDPPQFSLFWDFSRPRTEWEAISYIRLFFRPDFRSLQGYFEGRVRALSGTSPDRPVERLMDFLFPETYGVPLFRTQSERAIRAISGLSASEARDLTSESALVPGGPNLSENHLVTGAIRRGLSERLAGQLPLLFYVDHDWALLLRCIYHFRQMEKTPYSEESGRQRDWRIDPPLAARCFNSWFELVIRRYLRGHWRLPTGTARLPKLPSIYDCRTSFPDFTTRQVDDVIAKL